MGDVKQWVSDQLHDILGMSEKNVVDFIIDMAKRERDPNSLASKLTAFDIPNNERTQAFTQGLISRMPQSGPGRKAAYEREVREKAQFARRNQTYTTLEEEEGEELAPAARKPSSRKNIRRRQRSESPEPEPEPVKPVEPTIDSDEERERDIRERDALSERLKQRDDKSTRKVGMGKLEKEAEERNAELAKTPMEKLRERVADLRQASRQRYLKMRTEQKLEDLGMALQEEEEFFEAEELNEIERLEREIKQRAYKAGKQKMRDQDVDEQDPMYRMPEAYEDEQGRVDRKRQQDVLHRRYKDTEEDPNKTEQYYWEEEQLKKSAMGVGAVEGKARPKEYDLVFDEEQIDFIAETALAGEMSKLGGLKGKMTTGEGGDVDADPEDDEMLRSRKNLPVWPFREELIAAVREYQTLVIMGETGSGKTTQVPQFLIDAGFCKDGKKIGCTQPRRVAAMSVAARVAEEMKVKLGNEVGYSIRFEDCTSSRTILKYMTDGMLLREFLSEPDLESYSVLILDEAHERTLHTDILFGLLKDIARFRPDIKLLISSATLDAEKFSEYFDHAPVFNIPGRRYPVDIYYTKAPEADYIEAAVVTVLQIHVTQPSGDILVFLTGQEEIETMSEMLMGRTRGLGSRIGELLVLPIYATLPTDLQAKIFEPTPPGARKVVLATNIAETSITIDNIIFVIDPGFSKQTSYNPRTGMDSLIVTPISKASSRQRAGRAGRVAPGKCFRLFTAWAYQNELEENTIPEIQRTNLGNVVLMLKSLGIDDLIHFDFMDPPPAETLIKALEMLYALGALNDHGELTKLGRRMAEFPMDPMMSKAVIQSEKYQCTMEIIAIMSMLSVNNVIFYRPKDKKLHADTARKNFHKPGGDHMTLLNVYMQWADTDFSTQWCFENFVQVRSLKRARDVHEQLEGLCERVEVPIEESRDFDPFHENTGIRKAITSGFFPHTSKFQKGGNYRTVKHSQTVHVHPQSSLFEDPPRWVVYHELVYTTKEFMRQILEIDPKWLVEIAPHYYQEKDIHDSTTVKMPKQAGSAAVGS